MFCRKNFKLFSFIFLSTISFGLYPTDNIITPESIKLESAVDQSVGNLITTAKSLIQKKVLANGLTVLFYPITNSPEVSLNVIVDFGSRDEHEGQYGFAHMIEHMLFKGTPAISEVDINLIADKFGHTYFNAFTSHDQTVYVTQTDNKNWAVFLGILADCVQNASFDENHFNSEVKTVVSEINLHRKDADSISLAVCVPFNHPYAHAIGGLCEDLLNASASDLRKFYQENYTPEKTTLIIVGNINQAELFEEIDKLFGTMPAKQNPTKRIYCADAYLQPNFIQGYITVHTQTEGPSVRLWWLTPGAKNANANVASDAVCYFLNERLKKLEESYGLVFNNSVIDFQLLDLGDFSVVFEPKTEDFGKTLQPGSCVETVKTIILNEVRDLISNGAKQEELSSYKALIKTSFTGSFEYPREIASILSSYNINKNEFEAFDRFEIAQKLTSQDIKDFCKTFLKPNRYHQLNSVPLEENEKNEWIELQNSIDQYEKKLLENKNRESKLDEQKLLLTLPTPKEIDFNYEKPDIQTVLSNGLTVYIKQKDTSPNVYIGLTFKNAEYLELFYAQQHKASLPGYVFSLIAEETEGDQSHPEKFTSKENTEFFDALGATGRVSDGMVLCLSCDIEKVTEKLLHILIHPTYPVDAVNREINNDIQLTKQDQDNIGHILREALTLYLFEKYPWVQNDEQIIEDLKKISRQDIVNFYKQWFAPQNMFLTVVGNITPEQVVKQMEKIWGSWKNDSASNIDDLRNKVNVEDISNKPAKEIIKQHPDEQIMLMAARLSTYDGTDDASALSILSIYLNLKLNEIREKSGLFYYCNAEASVNSSLIKGTITITTQISPEKLDLAKNEIKAVLHDFSQVGISQEEFDVTKKNFRTSFAKIFATANSLFHSYRGFISCNKTFDYPNEVLNRIDKLTLEYVNSVAKKYLNPDEMTFAIGGRVASKLILIEL